MTFIAPPHPPLVCRCGVAVMGGQHSWQESPPHGRSSSNSFARLPWVGAGLEMLPTSASLHLPQRKERPLSQLLLSFVFRNRCSLRCHPQTSCRHLESSCSPNFPLSQKKKKSTYSAHLRQNAPTEHLAPISQGYGHRASSPLSPGWYEVGTVGEPVQVAAHPSPSGSWAQAGGGSCCEVCSKRLVTPGEWPASPIPSRGGFRCWCTGLSVSSIMYFESR